MNFTNNLIKKSLKTFALNSQILNIKHNNLIKIESNKWIIYLCFWHKKHSFLMIRLIFIIKARDKNKNKYYNEKNHKFHSQ